MPQLSFPVGGTIFAADGTSAFPDVTVTCRNITRNLKSSFVSDEVDGSYIFDLANPEFGGYGDGDSIEIIARIGPFYKRETRTLSIAEGPLDVNLTLAREDKVRILNFYRLNQELITFFRANLDDPKDRGTSRTETQSGTGTKVKFTLAEKNIKFIKAVTINDDLAIEWEDYYVDFQDKNTLNYPIVYFLNAPANGTEIEFIYSYGIQSWIYPDRPRIGLALDSYPRCKVEIFPINTREGGIGGGSNISSMDGEITIWSSKPNEAIDLASEARRLLIENKKSFHHFNFITPDYTGPLLTAVARGNRIAQLSQGFNIPLKLEKVEN